MSDQDSRNCAPTAEPPKEASKRNCAPTAEPPKEASKRNSQRRGGLSSCPTAPTLVIESERPARGDQTPPSGAYRYQQGPPLDRWIRFGDWLVRRGLISRADLYSALRRATSDRVRIGDAIVDDALLERAQVEQEASAFQSFQAGLRRGGERARPG